MTEDEDVLSVEELITCGAPTAYILICLVEASILGVEEEEWVL